MTIQKFKYFFKLKTLKGMLVYSTSVVYDINKDSKISFGLYFTKFHFIQ